MKHMKRLVLSIFLLNVSIGIQAGWFASSQQRVTAQMVGYASRYGVEMFKNPIRTSFPYHQLSLLSLAQLPKDERNIAELLKNNPHVVTRAYKIKKDKQAIVPAPLPEIIAASMSQRPTTIVVLPKESVDNPIAVDNSQSPKQNAHSPRQNGHRTNKKSIDKFLEYLDIRIERISGQLAFNNQCRPENTVSLEPVYSVCNEDYLEKISEELNSTPLDDYDKELIKFKLNTAINRLKNLMTGIEVMSTVRVTDSPDSVFTQFSAFLGKKFKSIEVKPFELYESIGLSRDTRRQIAIEQIHKICDEISKQVNNKKEQEQLELVRTILGNEYAKQLYDDYLTGKKKIAALAIKNVKAQKFGLQPDEDELELNKELNLYIKSLGKVFRQIPSTSSVQDENEVHNRIFITHTPQSNICKTDTILHLEAFLNGQIKRIEKILQKENPMDEGFVLTEKTEYDSAISQLCSAIHKELMGITDKQSIQEYCHGLSQWMERLVALKDDIHCFCLRIVEKRSDFPKKFEDSLIDFKKKGAKITEAYEALGFNPHFRRYISLARIKAECEQRSDTDKETTEKGGQVRQAGFLLRSKPAKESYDKFLTGPKALEELAITKEEAAKFDIDENKLVEEVLTYRSELDMLIKKLKKLAQ